MAKQTLQTAAASFDRRIAFRVRAFEIGMRDDAGPAMAGTGDKRHIQGIVFDQPVEMDIKKIQTWRRAPMPEQTRLDVFELQRGFEQWDCL